MAGGFNSGDDEVISGINVTPLVDVVLVLLIIFLITAPVIYQSAIKVQLPSAKSGEAAASKKSPYAFTLTKEGDLLWDTEKLSWEGFSKKLAERGPALEQETAIISADKETPHGIVVRLMDTLRQAGLSRFALNVDSAPGSK